MNHQSVSVAFYRVARHSRCHFHHRRSNAIYVLGVRVCVCVAY